ncbi:MAG: hypothetical protein ABI947_14400 [Chloroflexota bacterium]
MSALPQVTYTAPLPPIDFLMVSLGKWLAAHDWQHLEDFEADWIAAETDEKRSVAQRWYTRLIQQH